MNSEKVIDGLIMLKRFLQSTMWEPIKDAIEMLKEQPEIVRCKDCDNRECDGRAGTIVCGITGDSHSRLWFCADGKRKE